MGPHQSALWKLGIFSGSDFRVGATSLCVTASLSVGYFVARWSSNPRIAFNCAPVSGSAPS